eukprot:TRINITY_DN17085_c0_g1_i2.p1 TRINITY_DN17085_c0_g1~~TRINITY_DN17085_c0_g1_i2.p1  ORF type:complete len:961 (+),score=260.09 TRINITY_DN17085_c0_g1_i2:49-2883(+)
MAVAERRDAAGAAGSFAELQRLLKPTLASETLAELLRRLQCRAPSLSPPPFGRGTADAEAYLLDVFASLCVQPRGDEEIRREVVQWLDGHRKPAASGTGHGARTHGADDHALSPAELARLLGASRALRDAPAALLRTRPQTAAHSSERALCTAPVCFVSARWLWALSAAAQFELDVQKLPPDAVAKIVCDALPCSRGAMCVLKHEDTALAGNAARTQRVSDAAAAVQALRGEPGCVAVSVTPAEVGDTAATVTDTRTHSSVSGQAASAESDVAYHTQWQPVPHRGVTTYRLVPLYAQLFEKLRSLPLQKGRAAAVAWAFSLEDADGGRPLHEHLNDLLLADDGDALRRVAPCVALLQRTVTASVQPARRASLSGDAGPTGAPVALTAKALQRHRAQQRADEREALSPKKSFRGRAPTTGSSSGNRDSSQGSEVTFGSILKSADGGMSPSSGPRRVVLRTPSEAHLFRARDATGSLWLTQWLSTEWVDHMPQTRYEVGNEVSIARPADAKNAVPRKATVVSASPLSAMTETLESAPAPHNLLPAGGLLSATCPPVILRLRYARGPGGAEHRDDWLAQDACKLVGGRSPAPTPALYTPGRRLSWPWAVRASSKPPYSVRETGRQGSLIVFELRGAHGTHLPGGDVLLLPGSRWRVLDSRGQASPIPGSTLVCLQALPPLLPPALHRASQTPRRHMVVLCDPQGCIGAAARRAIFAGTLPRLWHDDGDNKEGLSAEMRLTLAAGTADALGVFARPDEACRWVRQQNALSGPGVSWTVVTSAGAEGRRLLTALLDADDDLGRVCRAAVLCVEPATVESEQSRWAPCAGPGVLVTADCDEVVRFATHRTALQTRRQWVALPDFLSSVYARTRITTVAYAWRREGGGAVYGGAELRKRRWCQTLTPRIQRLLRAAGYSVEVTRLPVEDPRGLQWPCVVRSPGMIPMRPYD